jgi:predicted fused transcriptional regulator/phosphomethylpyrimidine kinase
MELTWEQAEALTLIPEVETNLKNFIENASDTEAICLVRTIAHWLPAVTGA